MKSALKAAPELGAGGGGGGELTIFYRFSLKMIADHGERLRVQKWGGMGRESTLNVE